MANLDDNFKSLTKGEVEKILTVTTLAKKAGMDNLPDTHEITLDENERNIIVYVERQVQAANDIVYEKFSAFTQMVTKVADALTKVESLKLIHNSFKNKYKYAASKNIQELQIKKEIYELAKKDLVSFKAENKLIRQEKSSTKPLLNWAIVFAIVFGESILNSSFFAKGSDIGLLGGIIQAFVIVMINVLVANLVVLIIRRRNLNTINSIEKIGYTVLVGGMVSALVSFHFLVGHYRDALRIDLENAYALSVLNFSSTPFQLVDFESYILVLMGFLFFVVLIMDFYAIKDPYPGYAEVSHKYKEAKEEYDELKFAILDDEEEINNEINKKITLIIEDVKSVYADVQGIHISKQKLENKYNEHINSIKNLLSITIKSYRSMNSDMRSTPAPEYFKEEVEFNPQTVEFVYVEDKEKTVLLTSAIEALPQIELEVHEKIEAVKKELEKELLGEDSL